MSEETSTESAGEAVSIVRYGDHQRAFAELRLPDGGGPFPLAIVYHGGCWKAGIATQTYMAPLAEHWRKLGIASLNVDYREVGDGGGWPGSFEDWQASTRLIEQVARDYPIDRERVTLVGHSAGATPALWLASGQGEDGPVGARPALGVNGIIVLDGAGDVGLEQRDFDALCEFSSVHPFMGGTQADKAARYAAISPSNHPPKAARILFVQAVLPSPGDETVDAMRAGGADVRVIANPGSSHFEILTPDAPTYQALEPAMLDVLRAR
jgi:acetyl esterase/lipase